MNLGDSVIRNTQFDEEFQAEPELLGFVSLDGSLDVEVRLRFRTETVTDASPLNG
jgi:hypothetical protein